MAIAQDEPHFALFVAEKPDLPTTDSVWRSFLERWQATLKTKPAIEVLREGAAMLPLPDTLPTLCQFVADAQECGQKYKVRLFGQPLLSYKSPPDETQ